MGRKSFLFLDMREPGVEPGRLAALDPTWGECVYPTSDFKRPYVLNLFAGLA